MSNKQFIADVAQLENGGVGIVFKVQEQDQPVPAFAVRYQDVVRAFKNRCGHIAVTLDFQPGKFFTEEGDFLVCSTHGALYEPASGACTGGPCYGIGLEPLATIEEGGKLYLNDNSVTLFIDQGQAD